MEILRLTEDVTVLCEIVPTFPNGIDAAFKSLEKRFSGKAHSFYGISYIDEAGTLIYKTAVTASSIDDHASTGLKSFIILKADYLVTTLENRINQLPNIGRALMELMEDERADKTFPCVEWYRSDEQMLCMVKMKDQQLSRIN